MTREPDPADVAARLHARLGAEGEHVDDGELTIDAQRARTRLQRFQLADPHGYILLLVEAAAIAGAPSVELSCGRTSVAEFAGVALGRARLEGLLAALFVDLDGTGEALAAARIQQLIAVATNAALSLGPARLEIDNVDTDGSRLRLRVASDGSSELLVVGRGQPGWTRFAFVGAREDSRDDREVTLIRERCRYATMTVNLYGQQVSKGPRLAMLGLRTDRIRLGGATIGLAGFDPSSEQSGIVVILTRAVIAETLAPAWAARGFVAVVEVDLRKDLAQAAILRGPAFDAVVQAIRAAHDRIVRG